MRKESLIHKILRKLGFIKDIEDDREFKMEMCKRANGIFQGIYEHTAKTIVAWMPLPEPYKEKTE